MTLSLLKRLIPPSIARQVQASVFERLNLQRALESEIVVQVLSRTDWTLYNDIFVDGEYDAAIEAIPGVAAAGQKLLVFDVGANVGFFSQRLFQLLAAAGCTPTSVSVVAIEPSVANLRELKRRLALQGRWSNCVRIVPGLEGEKRAGRTVLFESHNYGMNTVVEAMRYAGARRTAADFVDIEQVVSGDSVIHLLKCDIEGAEFSFVENYQSFLGRVQVAVFEVHHRAGNVEQLRATLAKAGLSDERLVVDRGDTSVRMYARPLGPGQQEGRINPQMTWSAA